MISAALPFPDISPEIFAFTIGGFTIALRWYALAYIAGLLIGWWIAIRAVRRPALWPRDEAPMTSEQVEALLTWIILGVILGGRLGYVLFYDLPTYIADPVEIIRVWNGGMAFHGGFLGVVVAAALFCRLEKIPMLQMGDMLAMVAPIGLLLGRLANFTNAELWGRPTDASIGVIFPGFAAQDCLGPEGLSIVEDLLVCARHPSQLYEALLEGLLLGAILLWLAWRRGALKRPGLITGLFLAGYGVARFIVEFFRQPDLQFYETNPNGFALSLSPEIGLTMGQLLSLPMILLGIFLLVNARRSA